MYPDSPLAHREIRLLHIFNDTKAPYELRLELRRANLDNVPKFAALSYTWATVSESLSPHQSTVDLVTSSIPQEHTYEVQCNQGCMHIRENLFHFLQWLRRRADIEAFWIDAVCINQDDLDERSAQVMLMGSVYRDCSKVYIWLGQSPISDVAMRIVREFLPAILRDWERRGYDSQFYRNKDMFCLDEELRQTMGEDICDIWEMHWRDFVRIFERRWFSRGWIVQEVCIRRLENCSFIAGEQEIEYQHLEDFDKFLARVGWTQQLYAKTVDTNFANARGGMACFSNLRDILAALGHDNAHNRDHLQAIYGASTAQQIWYAVYAEVVARVRWRRVTDPRDVVYACLGMMQSIASSEINVRVHVDYHLTVEEVYTQFAALWVQEHPFINVLSAREDVTARRYKDLPSWVPDFSQGISHNALVRSSDFYRNEQGHNHVFGRRFNASKSTVEDVSQREVQGGTLILRGVRLTTVDWCDAYDEHESKLLTSLTALRFATQDRLHIGTDDTMFDAVWKTLIVDDPPPTLNREACPETFRAWLLAQISQLWTECSADGDERGSYLRAIESLLSSSKDPGTRRPFTLADIKARNTNSAPMDPQAAAFHVAFKVAMRGRILFTTSQGHLGLGMRSTQKDDEVWVLKGVNVPVISRIKGETHELVGESYVHGAMYGEGVSEDVEARFASVKIA